MKKIVNDIPYTENSNLGYRVPYSLNNINTDGDKFGYIQVNPEYEELLREFNLFECLLTLLNYSLISLSAYPPDIIIKNECITIDAIDKTTSKKYTHIDILLIKTITSVYRIHGNDEDAYLNILELNNKLKNVYIHDNDTITEVVFK